MAERLDEVEIDLSSVTSPEELHALLARELCFPAYYGKNWDAFWDCIRDPEQSRMPAHLVVRGMSLLQQSMPREAQRFHVCLRDFIFRCPEFRVSWA
jgi:RNAse (barnase) inhibitor barstar